MSIQYYEQEQRVLIQLNISKENDCPFGKIEDQYCLHLEGP